MTTGADRKREMAMKIRKGSFYPRGVTAVDGGVQFVFQTQKTNAEVSIGLFAGERELARISVPEELRHGLLYSVVIEGIPKRADGYRYYEGGKLLCDRYARGVIGMRRYGKERGELFYALPGKAYDWGDDRPLRRPYSASVIYGLHVRGFTKHASSGVAHKGTFAGIREKLPYLQALGITAIELMPAYEFDEVEKTESPYQKEAGTRLNYWGFKPGYYYAPKSAYAHDKNASAEMKDMIRALHKAGIEVLMQFYFSGGGNASEIPDILHFWAEEYHIDGFRLIGEKIPSDTLAADPFLRETKLICGEIPLPGNGGDDLYPNRGLALWRQDFACAMRRALKGDDGSLEGMLYHLRDKEERAGVVNAIASYDGFTLCDLVSYDRKHNEENGEDNRDGSDYNYSWNCGAEGRTRKRAIQSLRRKQIRNALALLFLSQGTPYLRSGDEFGQTQGGNNNPYCQDNPVTWLDWKLTQANAWLLDYTRRLIAFRRAHTVFSREYPLHGADYLGYGCPDISFHGEEAWKPELYPGTRNVGVLYSGKYAQTQSGIADNDFYVAFNLHWEEHRFALPRLPKGMRWRLCMDTAQPEEAWVTPKGEPETSPQVCAARSIQIYQSEKEDGK